MGQRRADDDRRNQKRAEGSSRACRAEQEHRGDVLQVRLECAGAGGVAIWGLGGRRSQQQQRAAADKYTPVITKESGSCYAWRSSMADWQERTKLAREKSAKTYSH
jgi:hypothetical protein